MSVTTIKSKIRYLIGDNSTPTKDIFTYDSSSVFPLTEDNVIAVTTAYKNSVELSSGDYSYDSDTNKVTVSASLTSGDTVEIDFTCYQNYSDTELVQYIQAALVHLSINNYLDLEYDSTDDAIYPDIEFRDENLVAIVSSIIIKPDNKSINLPNLSIRVPKDLPVNDKISKAIALYKKNHTGIFEIL